MKGEALGPVKSGCSIVGECQDREAGADGLGSRRREDGIGSFGGETRKEGKNCNVNKITKNN